jgi:Family of unknown function (DUF5343)
MALPKAYLTSAKNLPAILNAIQTAKAPPKFTQRFLESLEFKSPSDRLITGVLKALKFISAFVKFMAVLSLKRERSRWHANTPGKMTLHPQAPASRYSIYTWLKAATVGQTPS